MPRLIRSRLSWIAATALVLAVSCPMPAHSGTASALADEQPAAAQLDHDSFLSPLRLLSGHLSGEATLEAQQINAAVKVLDQHKSALGNSAVALNAAVDFIEAYDARHQPLFIGYRQLHKRQPKPEDPIHWAAFWVMQHVFDEVYTTPGLAIHADRLDGLAFATADYFPGKVEAPAVASHSVKIDGSYPDLWAAPFFQEDRPARKPTGSYLIPGTIATVVVPEALVDQGYQVRVGAHSWDLIKKPRVSRLYRVSAVYDITSTHVKVANPLGGGIYIEVPPGADAGVVEVTVKDAARSPYFSAKPFHQTTLEQWLTVERHHKAPWADFQSEQYMMQVPTSWVYALDDPVTLMAAWDKSLEVSNEFMGRPKKFGRETLYNQVDTQLRGRAFHPGYPAGNRMYDPTQDYGGNYAHHLIQGPQVAHSYEFHELGHAYLFPKYPGQREAVVNLPHVAVMNIAFDVPLDEAFRSSRSMDEDTFRTLDTTATAWMMNDFFLANEGMPGYEAQYQLKGHARYVDIARLFGWQPLSDFYKQVEADYAAGNPWPRTVDDTDMKTMHVSKHAQADLRPILHFWGVPTVDMEKTNADYKAMGIKPSAKVYDLLVQYRDSAPSDNKAFRAFTLKWWGKQPSPEGYSSERNHAARWENYDAKLAAQTRAVVQSIIDQYFPDGRPAE